LTDGDGSFSFSIIKRPTKKVGFTVLSTFCITAGANSKNYKMIILVQEFFGEIGRIAKNEGVYQYTVQNFANCIVIRNHFIQYPLLTYKLVYFSMWCNLMQLMEADAHLTLEGLKKIVSIKAASKNGLNSILLGFPSDTVAIERPDYNPVLSNMNYNWLAKFLNSDGSFGLNLLKNKNFKLGFTVIASIRIYQDKISLVVLESIISMLGNGRLVKPSKGRTVFCLTISDIKSIFSFILIMDKHRLYGAKYLDYMDFRNGVAIIQTDGHLTSDGLEEIKAIIRNMNSFRKF